MDDRVRVATIDRLYAAGFKLGPRPGRPGPDPDDRCPHGCPHRWGDHRLVVPADSHPIFGGQIRCGDDTCRCSGTFSAPQARRWG